MLLFVKPLAKGHSCFESLDLMPGMLGPAEGCTPESYLFSNTHQEAFYVSVTGAQRSRVDSEMSKEHYCTLPEPQKFDKLPSTSLDSWAPVLQLHLSLNEEVLPAVSQLLQVRAGRLCAVRLQPVVLGSLTQEQWRGSGYQQHGQGPGPGPGSEVALDLEAIAAVPNVEEDKMKQHPSLPRTGSGGRREQGANLWVGWKKRGGRSW